MGASINVDVAELVGLVVECILYGIFVILHGAAMYLTFLKRQRAKINKVMVLVAIMMLILATIQLIADTTSIFLAFISRDRADRIAFMQDVTQPVFIVKHTTLILMILVSDSFVTYRCWVVWKKNFWVVILPICLTLGSAVTGFHAIWSFSNYRAESRADQEKWLIAISSLSLVANALSTFLAAIYIWNSSRRSPEVIAGGSLMPVVKIVIESGVFSAAYMFANVITLVTETEGLETMAELGTPFLGCIFMLMIIRVCVNSGHTLTSSSQKSSMTLRSLPGRDLDGARERRRRAVPQHNQFFIEQEVFVSMQEGEPSGKDSNGKPDPEFVV